MAHIFNATSHNEVTLDNKSNDDDIAAEMLRLIPVTKGGSSGSVRSSRSEGKRSRESSVKDAVSEPARKRIKSELEPIDLCSDSDDEDDIALSSTSASGTYFNPISIMDDDELDSCEGDVDILHARSHRDFPSPARSTSLDFKVESLSRGMHNFTIKAEETTSGQDGESDSALSMPPSHNKVLDSWRSLKLKDKTMSGLETLKDLPMASSEKKAFLDAVRDSLSKNIVTNIAEDTLLTLVVAILEVMRDSSHRSSRKPEVLVVAPFRHVAEETKTLFQQIGRFYELYTASLIGGIPTYQCIRQLQQGLDVVCGTPGKLMDMTLRGELEHHMQECVLFAMVSADIVLESESMSAQMCIVAKALPTHMIRMIWLESALLNAKSSDRATRYVRRRTDPHNTWQDSREHVRYVRADLTRRIECVEHVVAETHKKWKKLEDAIDYFRADSIIVFFNTKRALYDYRSRFDNVFCLDSTLSNQERKDVVRCFARKRNVLFTTDLVIGLRLKASVLINFDIPWRRVCGKYLNRMMVSKSHKAVMITLIHAHSQTDKNSLEEIEKELKLCVKRWTNFVDARKNSHDLRKVKYGQERRWRRRR